MAKIYETRTDFERDKLKEQANRLYRHADGEAYVGLAFFGGGWITRLYNEAAKTQRGWIQYVAWAAEAVGVVGIIKSWFTRHKAHDLALQRERLGPEQVVLPPEMTPQQQPDCRPCAVKDLIAAGSRTPRDFAETPASPDPAVKR